ncbi:MAG TPA: integrase arm-type DNA-binding domain-containing protein [Candidatus Ozemobacteraceae bacterium]|nr:integrase arm-type DNA-binding domain-containing protein [Candidatus Ozemobacteraceae bacterium]
MAKRVVPLTDATIRAAIKKRKAGKAIYLFDGHGLYLHVSKTGATVWNWKFRHKGIPKLKGFGVYPKVTLARARELRSEGERLLTQGINPIDRTRAEKETRSGANTFESKAREWFLVKKAPDCSPGHADHIKSYLDRDIIPWLGKKAISAVTPDDLLSVARRVEQRGAIATAHRVIGVCSEIFCYAIGVRNDPTLDVRDKLRKIPKPRHRAAATSESGMIEPQRVGALLRILDGYEGGHIVRCAVRLGPLVFVRPGELRTAQWKDINLDAGEWHLLASKTNTQHIVPLSRQAMAILRDIFPLTGDKKYVFPNPRSPDGSRPMSENAVLAAYRSLGIGQDELCGHGWRAIARTLLDERLRYRTQVIEKQLAHVVKDQLGTAYNRTEFLDERREMMQRWADYLDELKGAPIENPITVS